MAAKEINRERWKFLIQSLKSGQVTGGSRFPSFNLFKWNSTGSQSRSRTDEECQWFLVSLNDPSIDQTLKVPLFFNRKLTSEILTGFNNTGNVYVWPSEECLAIFGLENPQLFKSKKVVELGAGMTGLSGLTLAIKSGEPPSRVILTDGNSDSVSNLDRILGANKDRFQCQVESRVLRWGHEDDQDEVNVVICADCLFFDEGRPLLVNCLDRILKPGGTAYIVAPERKGTFSQFVQILAVRNAFKFEVSEDYSPRVTKVIDFLKTDQRFHPDEHLPKMIKIWKT